MSISLTRRQPVASTTAGKNQETMANVLVLKFVSQYFDREKIKVQIKGRGKWFEGSSENQIIILPVTHGINFRNVITLGASKHRRDPVSAIHLWSRSPEQIDAMREEIDRIVITYGVNPYEGVGYILPAEIPTVAQDPEQDEASTLYHDIYFVKVLYYKNKP